MIIALNILTELLGYFNGTPAATAVFAIDIIAPMHFGKESIDLVVSGPNEGSNNGPFLYTISGTIGAAYASVERGVSRYTFDDLDYPSYLVLDSSYRIICGKQHTPILYHQRRCCR